LSRRFFRFRRTRRLLWPQNIFAGFVASRPRFFAARAALRLRLVARRLDAAERAAEFVNFALVGNFLALGQLDEFENFIQLVNRVLQRFGNFGGVRDGLADGGNVGGAKISGFDPRLRARRLRAAFGTLVALRKFARARGRRTDGFRFGRGFSGRRHFFRRRGFGMFFGMRFTEVAGRVGFVLRNFGVNGGFFRRFRRG
jgi:hypothetical protein